MKECKKCDMIYFDHHDVCAVCKQPLLPKPENENLFRDPAAGQKPGKSRSGATPGLWVAAILMIGGILGLPDLLVPGLSLGVIVFGLLIGLVDGLTHGFKRKD